MNRNLDEIVTELRGLAERYPFDPLSGKMVDSRHKRTVYIDGEPVTILFTRTKLVTRTCLQLSVMTNTKPNDETVAKVRDAFLGDKFIAVPSILGNTRQFLQL